MKRLVYICAWKYGSSANGMSRPPDKCIEQGCIGEHKDKVPARFRGCIVLADVLCEVKETPFQHSKPVLPYRELSSGVGCGYDGRKW